MKPILLLLFAATAACVGALLPLISRARSKRLLLNAVRRASSDAPDGIGISVLCSGVTDAAQIENLLSPEYSRYEVIVVLDARRHAAEFAALTARYRMIRVEWVCWISLQRTYPTMPVTEQKSESLPCKRGVLYRQPRIQRRSLSMRCTMNLMRLFPRWQVTEHSQLTVVRRKKSSQ